MNYKPIENYGLIGDLNTTALVGMDGSIDFMCFPQFDSPTIFAALLDFRKGGRFLLAPQMTGVTHKQLYMPDSNVLLSRFLADQGMAEVSDFMPITSLGHSHNLVRRAKCIRGEIPFRMICEPRFDCARASHRVHRKKNEVLFLSDGADKTVLRLRSDVPLQIENGAAVADFKLRSGEKRSFILEDAGKDSESPSRAPDYVAESFKQTMNFWRDWVGLSRYRGRWRSMVSRSALTQAVDLSALWFDGGGRHVWVAGRNWRRA